MITREAPEVFTRENGMPFLKRFGLILLFGLLLSMFAVVSGHAADSTDTLTVKAVFTQDAYSSHADETTFLTARNDPDGSGGGNTSTLLGYFDVGAAKRVYYAYLTYPLTVDLTAAGTTVDSVLFAFDGLGDYGDGNNTASDAVKVCIASAFTYAPAGTGTYDNFYGFVASAPNNGVLLADTTWVDNGTANGRAGYTADWNYFYANAAGIDTLKAHSAGDDSLRIAIMLSQEWLNIEPVGASAILTFSSSSVADKEPEIIIYYTVEGGSPPAAPTSIDTLSVASTSAHMIITGVEAGTDSILAYDNSTWIQSFVAADSADFVITGLTPETEYDITASLKNENGEGDPCETSIVFVTPAAPAGDDNIYVLAGESGTGASWADALGTITGAEAIITRGDTIFVSDGAYSEATTFNVAASGSDSIFVVKATVANHGTATGWDNAYGDGQATFTSNVGWVWLVTSSCWVFDGVSKTTDMTGHGFALVNENTNPTPPTGTATGLNINSGGGDVEGIRAQYIAVYGPGETYVDNYNDGFVAYGMSGSLTDVYIGNCYSWGFREADLKASAVSNLIYEYNTGNIDSTRTIGVATHGGGTIINDGLENANITIRYNTLIYPCGTSCIEILTNGSGQDYIGGIYIYGNRIINGYSSNGIVGNGSQSNTLAQNWYVYNNTMYGNLVTTGQLVFFGSAGTFSADYTGCYAYNNLFAGTTKDSGTWVINGNDHDFNAAYFDIPNETNNVILSTDVFADSSAHDFHLLESVPGDSIANITTNNLDLDGVLRGIDTFWDIGMYEFNASAVTDSTLVGYPQITIITVGDSLPYTAVVTDENGVIELPTLTWVSNNPALADFVNSDNVLYALAAGSDSVFVTCTETSVSDTLLFTVINAPATATRSQMLQYLINDGEPVYLNRP